MSSPSICEGNDAVLVGLDDVRDLNVDNILPVPVSDVVEIKNWLQPTRYDLERSEYSRHRDSYLAGTGNWFKSTTTYQQWHDGDNGLLWVKGIPGSGKSVLAASIINQLQKDGIPVIYFFFRQIIDANHQPVAALRDWLCQVLDYSPPLQVKLKSYVEEKRPLESLSPSDLWKDLMLALATFTKIYCVTDALDEMDQGNDEFLHMLVGLGQWRPLNVKVLITSRPVEAVENSLRLFSIPNIRLEERLVDLDIASYVQYKLHHSSIPRESWSIIEDAIPGRAHGLFLYAKLSMDAFLEPGADAHEVLNALPADLNVMYNDLLHEHARRSSVPDDLQLLVLQFVTHATRPLRILEIADMAKIVMVNTRIEDRSLKETKALVRAACGPLLEILPDETVSVVHHSFTEFLKGLIRSSESDDSTYPILQMGQTNKRLAIACLEYIQSGCLSNRTLEMLADIDEDFYSETSLETEIRLQYPFLEYAAKNWYTHVRRAARAGVEMSLVYTMLDDFFASEQIFSAWRAATWQHYKAEGIGPLHVAAWAGLNQYATRLIEKGHNIEVRDSRQNTPLYWAATCGHNEVVQVLLANGADANAEQHQGYNSLHVAAKKNYAQVAKTLLAAGVDPLTPKTKEAPGRWCGSAPRSCGHTPLMYACHNGHVETVAEFLPFLESSKSYPQALVWGAEQGQGAVVELILRHPGVDVNAKYRGDTALFKACAAGDEKTINFLLQAGADPNVLCQADKEFAGIQYVRMPDDQADQYPQRGHTALHVLLKSPTSGKKTSMACVESLLQAGADIHARRPDGCTALHFAFQHQAADIVRLLLDSGADPTEEDDYGATPLHAGWREDPGSLHVLLNTGLVDVNKAIDKSGKTPLLCRLNGFNPEAALALLEEYNPDVNIVDNSGNGPLHAVFARPSCYREEPWGRVIDLLIARGANPHAKNREGNTPLHVIRDQHSQFISKMLAAGADLEARNYDGQTVLFKHINAATWKEDQIPLFQNLINLGSRIDARDSYGRTLLHQCCINTDRLDFLISIGLDPLATDHRGNSLLMEVVAAHCEDDQRVVIDHLIGLGLDIDQPNLLGRTPLHTLCASVKIFRYLSDSMEHHLSHIMRLCKNISPADRHGVQPLHLAATISEARVFELLDAGADMFGVTHEGMSVLHIAARARQPNIVALFCYELSNLGEPTRMELLNQQNYEGQTALHFACRSGRLETVKVLLEAGANPNILDSKKHSPFRFCAPFEAEQQLWVNNNQLDHREFLDAAGVLLNDNARPFVGPSPCGQTYYEKPHTEHSALRLDEILALLVCHGALSIGKNECFRHAFDHAISNRYEYTVECLTRLQARFPDLVPDIKPSILLRSDYRICKYRLNATKQALKEVGDFDNNRDSDFSLQYNFMEDLILNGHCDLFEERIKKKYDYLFQLSSSGKSLLHCLVTWGYRDLLARVCNRDAALKYDDHDWCLKAEQKFDCRKSPVEPLLVKACARELPNMDVVELLVEKFSISLNAQRRTASWDLEVPQVTEGPLHVLAAGHNWWHVDKALPYLIKKGANLEIRDENAMTPLHTALDSSRSRGPFYKIAIKVLIESGADVNAVDSHGKTCLSKVGDDVELVKLLVAHGAHVTAAAVFSAIEGAQIEILRILLSHVDCANIKRSETGFEHVDYFASFKLLYSETPPLLYAAISRLRSLPLDSVSSATKTGIIMTLLDHGADPFATFFLQMPSPSKQHSDRYDSEEIVSVFDGPDSSCSKSEREPRARTVIHEVFKNGGLVAPFFQLPSLQLEIRDSAGCTLLLAASQNLGTLHTKIKSTEAGKTVTKSVFQELIDRGADLMAQDNDGNTILHHITCFDFDSELFETLKEIISKTTGLLHQPDSAGNAFFHRVLALRKFSLIDDLLNMEVDPLQSDSNGDTVLHHLAGCLKQKEIQNYFTRFVGAGLDINSRNNQGSTPLLMYIENGVVPPSSYERTVDEEEHNHTETVFDFFEERGADFFTRNDSGSSLLHLLASKKENNSHGPQIPHNVVRRFKILMSRGLDPMAEDARQRTSLDVAAACGSEHILKLFSRRPME